jgi:mycofactocin precursor
MTDPSTTTEEPLAGGTAVPPDDREQAAPLVEAELLVEEISIDGMCGVY